MLSLGAIEMREPTSKLIKIIYPKESKCSRACLTHLKHCFFTAAGSALLRFILTERKKKSLKYWSLSQRVHTLFTTDCLSRLLLDSNQWLHHSVPWVYILSTSNSLFKNWHLDPDSPEFRYVVMNSVDPDPCLFIIRQWQKARTDSSEWQTRQVIRQC